MTNQQKQIEKIEYGINIPQDQYKEYLMEQFERDMIDPLIIAVVGYYQYCLKFKPEYSE